ncbi:putative dehydrogenase [Pseudooceanicola batsensis HTCC2597]|uniref:Putative dehydrogenase n=1 Tax=Pseudooceanicola batsensis (strain ATCC BAA-863 / DSM 15984 / KCTC 12145 / HTCC2597) TaxID=252305 RepID=A3U2I0_PSEBH|nr:MaoC/PaaZ C-terminal domain-containing protein [Pseudooceanicola batsensis]EAQ01554.1 putative dehydrogenase [Pseudooceanicola batsensis HTCC2597]
MAIPENLTELRADPVTASWGDREVMLYALGIGMGEDPLNETELAFVNEGWITPREPALRVVPTFASVATWEARPPALDLNRVMVVDAQRDITFHKPLPVSATVTAASRWVGAWDKGDKGAILVRETEVTDQSGEPLYTLQGTTFARGDGNFGGPATGQPETPAVPERSPGMSVDIPVRPGQALLYRLSGDRNPLHSDPEFAARAGFKAPILHGMCTYGITCRAVLQTFADWDPAAIRRHAARFSAPVYPGETITVDLWREGRTVRFQGRIAKRGVICVSNGVTELA